MINSFRISIAFKNSKMFQAQAEKLKDFTRLFQKIEDAWVGHNQDKFDKAVGGQDLGVAFPDGIFWHELSEAYAVEKELAGFDDWLMVRTGELMRSLTQRGTGWFSIIEPQMGVWGTDNENAVRNAETRPTVWLDPVDRRNINDLVLAWLEDRPPFKAGLEFLEVIPGSAS